MSSVNAWNAAPTDLAVALSPEWLSRALSVTDAPIRVTSVRVVEELRTRATKIRVVAGAPSAGTQDVLHLCVKGFFGMNPLPLGMARNGQAEVRYYTELSRRSRVAAPSVRYAAIDDVSGHGILIMDDVVAAGGSFLNALTPYSLKQARSSLAQLARLHVEHRDRVGEPRYSWVPDRLSGFAAAPVIPHEELQDLLDGERGRQLPSAILDARRLHAGLARLAASSSPLDHTVVHGDAHPGNLFVLGNTVAVADWQLVQRNHWALDVAYHLGSSLTVTMRRDHEARLLRYYLECVRAEGGSAPRWDVAWTQYRRHMVYGYYLWAITRFVDPATTHELVTRLGTAVADLRSLTLLEGSGLDSA